MKIAFGFKLREGPFGGGNQFVSSLSKFLITKGFDVVFDLKDNDIDIILITDPRKYISSCEFDVLDAISYKQTKNKNVKIIQRINECDERKKSKFVNFQIKNSAKLCDKVVFISNWLADLLGQNLDFEIILNGADKKIFKKYNIQNNSDKIKFVTHHWGDNFQKGWDIYLKFDKLLDKPEYKKYEFHYIGKSKYMTYSKNIIYHKPTHGVELAKLLSSFDIYVSGSINEPAGMHHIEGALCGLPVLFRNSGALPEYNLNFGVSFNDEHDFEDSLYTISKSYKHINMKKYPNDSNKMCDEYLDLFRSTIKLSNKNLPTLIGKIKNWLFTRIFFKTLYRFGIE